VGTADAGSSPVRVVLSGGHAWVTARGSNALLSFDVEALTAGRKALRVVLPVGPNPIGVATVHAGSVVVTANSNRYGGEPHRPQSLSVVDAAAALAGRPALRGFVPAGAFPRQLVALPDDRTVLFVNVFSQTLQEVEIPPIQ
jgi:DNA-binding beta-propeller fold protein YncE